METLRALTLSSSGPTWRGRLTAVVAVLLATSGLALGASVAPATAAPAYSFACDTVYSVDGSSPQTISQLNLTSGAGTANGQFALSGTTVNALAIPAGGGRYAYAFNRGANQVVRFDGTTGTVTAYAGSAGSSASAVVAGAINPANGIFYYASGGTTWNLYAFDTTTNTPIGQIGTVTGSSLASNGDMAFDSLGNLYIVSNDDATAAGYLARVSSAVPTTAGTKALGTTKLTDTPANTGRYASMAIDSGGQLVIGAINSAGTGGTVLRVNPATGAVLSTVSTSLILADMASCAVPSTGSVEASLPGGRYHGGDQFTVAITGGGVTSGNTGTTAGTDAGDQNGAGEVGGPVLTQRSTSYTVTQSAATGSTTNLADYTTTWACVNMATGATLSSGTGNSGSYTSPATAADVLCTFTDTPLVPAIDLTKTASTLADTNGDGVQDAGDKVTYSYTVKNTGAVALSSVSVTDTVAGAITCPSATLPVGGSMTCTSKAYTLTQGDVDAGTVVAPATATGTSPTNNVVTDTASTTTPVNRVPSVSIDQTASGIVDTNKDGKADPGDTVTYDHKVTNTGNVTLTGISVTDPLLGTLTCPTGPLAPGASETCTATSHALTQAEVDAAEVDTKATVVATAPTGTKPATVTDSDPTAVPVPSGPAIDLVETASAVADTNGNGKVDPGDKITYSYKLTNTGTSTLSTLAVSDPLVGTVTCPSGTLAPGASTTCTATTYAITQADIDAGRVDNPATASGVSPKGVKVTDPDSVTTLLTQAPAVKLTKTASAIADTDKDGTQDAGDTITFHYVVTNTGTTTLTSVSVRDDVAGAITCPSGPLAPGASVTCTDVAYRLTQADVDAGSVLAPATVTGKPASGAAVTATDSTTTPVAAAPAVTLDKSSGGIEDLNGNGPDAGDHIVYSFTVTNSGNVTLHGLTVSDPKFGDVDCPGDDLAPGAVATCDQRTYVVTQDDIDGGKVVNTATASATSPSGTVVHDSDTNTVTITGAKTNLVTSISVSDEHPVAGQTLTYTVTVKNNGAVAAADVSLQDTLPQGLTLVSATPADSADRCTTNGNAVTCALGTLAKGASTTVTLKATVDAVGDSSAPHYIDVQKVEAQVDLDPGQTRTVSVDCGDGYLASDGSGRIDEVDQDAGTLASVHVLASQATGPRTWSVTMENDATGRAQGKVFAVCVAQQTSTVDGHSHAILASDPITRTVALPQGTSTVSLSCAPGSTPVQPGFAFDAPADLRTSYPATGDDGAKGWTWVVDNAGSATQATFSLRCASDTLSSAGGHTDGLRLDTVQQTVSVPAGQVVEYQLTCADDAKGIVAGFDLDAGLVNLGNDPRPKTRAFRLDNPTAGPLNAKLWLLCLSTSTTGGSGGSNVLPDTATATTSTPETSYADNSASVTVTVGSGSGSGSAAQAAVPAAMAVAFHAATSGITRVRCAASSGVCAGRVSLAAERTQRVHGHVVRRGTVLATATYRLAHGTNTLVHLRATRAGRSVLRTHQLRRAVLHLGKARRVVSLRY